MTAFVARTTFDAPSSIPKTYFLGHHQAGASRIRSVMSSVSLALECRDFRLPLSTRNPVLERAMGGCERLIVYTKSDLGSDSRGVREKLRRLHGDSGVVFWDKNAPGSTASLLRRLADKARQTDSLTGLRTLVVGMPNVGKSSLLNALRSSGLPGRAKAARTGDQAGVTRKIGTSVRIIEGEDKGGVGAGVFVLDSPGIFQPYVDDGETMIKVALVHGIKKGLIQDEILADYLLFRMNLWDPRLYSRYCEPTNDVLRFLEAVARRDGKLRAGGVPNIHESAARILSLWRDGNLGRYVMDDVSDDAIRAHERLLAEPALSLNQAKKLQKHERKEKLAS